MGSIRRTPSTPQGERREPRQRAPVARVRAPPEARSLGEAPGLLNFARTLSQNAESLIRDLKEDRENLGMFRIVIFGKVNSGKICIIA